MCRSGHDYCNDYFVALNINSHKCMNVGFFYYYSITNEIVNIHSQL